MYRRCTSTGATPARTTRPCGTPSTWPAPDPRRTFGHGGGAGGGRSTGVSRRPARRPERRSARRAPPARAAADRPRPAAGTPRAPAGSRLSDPGSRSASGSPSSRAPPSAPRTERGLQLLVQAGVPHPGQQMRAVQHVRVAERAPSVPYAVRAEAHLDPVLAQPVDRQHQVGRGGRPWSGRSPAPASADASSSRSRPVRPGTQKTWLTVTLPCSDSARVRSMTARSEASPVAARSCRWMSTPTPCRSAMPKTMSSCSSSAPSKPGRCRRPGRPPRSGPPPPAAPWSPASARPRAAGTRRSPRRARAAAPRGPIRRPRRPPGRRRGRHRHGRASPGCPG